MTKQTIARQCGFNLVEIAIVVVITGMVIGGLVVPSYTLLTEDAYDGEERRMQNIKQAVLGYAFTHLTNNTIVEVSENGENTRVFELPAGRPYLPCPDITGDGHEDRVLYDETGVISPAVVTLTVDRAAGVNNPIIHIGSCAATRGVLPWRTLGVQPSDFWGNLYTYEVDGIFADSLVGFNQNSTIDEFDIRTQIIVVGGADRYEKRVTTQLTITRGAVMIETPNYPRPPVVCASGVSGNVCVVDNTLTLTINIIGGRQSDGEFQSLFRRFADNDITDGVPFVVVSHGKNGHGAVNHARIVEDKIIANSTITVVASSALAPHGLICNWPASGTVALTLDLAEAINFPQTRTPVVGGGTRCNPNIAVRAQGEQISSGFMLYQPRSSNFDDLVMWVERGELVDIMSANKVLPAPDFPALRPY